MVMQESRFLYTLVKKNQRQTSFKSFNWESMLENITL